jgi:hypothetical protein
MRMNMIAVYDKVKPDIEHIRGLNLAVVKLICSIKPVLTEDLCVVQKQGFFNKRAECTLHGRPSIFITENPSSLQRGCYIRTNNARVQLEKKKSLVVGIKGLDAKTN